MTYNKIEHSLLNMDLSIFTIHSYAIMTKCWAVEPEDRPTFAELRATFDIMMANQQTESYVDLNVDDLLPYYQMKPAEEGEEDTKYHTLPVSATSGSCSDESSNNGPLPDNNSIDEPVF